MGLGFFWPVIEWELFLQVLFLSGEDVLMRGGHRRLGAHPGDQFNIS
jgi:hypothetical protein